MFQRLLARKKIDVDSLQSSTLKRVLGPVQLTFFGVGAIIGTGIFILTGNAAAGTPGQPGAGPAIVLSFLITGFACALAAMCYAEFASMIPASGSAYTYAYASFGELVAWIIGWDLILEYAVGNIAIAIGWSSYFMNVLNYVGIDLPAWLCIDPVTFQYALGNPREYPDDIVQLAQAALASAPYLGFSFVINLPAVLIVGCITALLYVGVQESSRANTVLVLIKIGMIALFLYAGLPHVNFQEHWHPYMPHGFSGVMGGAAIVFFAYIGFDAVSTAAEETRNPQRDLPIAMIASLLICTMLYILVATVLTGMTPLETLRNAKPVAAALSEVGEHSAATVISLGAALSMASVLLVLQMAQTRIFYAMSRDRLLPPILHRVHPRFQTPHFCTLITGLIVAIPAGLIDIRAAADLCNIGTLFAFILVAVGILILRIHEPDRHRSFRTPLVWVIAPGCVVACLALMVYLSALTWMRFGGWLLIGLIVYFSYGFRRKEIETP